MNTTRPTSMDLLDKHTEQMVKFPDYQNGYNKPCKFFSVNEYLSLSAYSSNEAINKKSPLHVTQSILSPHIQRIDHTDQQLPISIALEHDVFDIKFGLVRNIIYSGNVYMLR